MSCINSFGNINETFVIEPLLVIDDTLTACTGVFTNQLYSCSGDTSISLGSGLIIINGNISASDITANTINASTYLSGGTNLLDIFASAEVKLTGGTFNTNTKTLTLKNNDGSDVVVTGFTDYYTTGVTYSDNTFTFTTNSGSTYSATFNTLTGLTINGNFNVTGNTVLNTLTATTISATTYENLPLDIYTTGVTLINNIVYFNRNDQLSAYTLNLSSFTTSDYFITGATYANNTFTFTNNTGGTFNVSFNTLTGLTINGDLSVTGNTSLQNLSVSTISATTYQNLPTYVSATTLSANVLTVITGNGSPVTSTIDAATGGTYNPSTGIITLSGTGILGSITGISGTYITGFTYSTNTFTINDSSGQTFSALFNTLTGLTIDGNLIVTGDTILGALTASTISANTISAVQYNNLPIDPDTYVTGFTFDPITYLLDLKQNTNNPTYSAFTANLAILASDVTITGGSYNPNTGVATFTNNSGGTFDVSGFTSGLTDTIITNFDYTPTANTFTINQSNGSAFTATFTSVSGLTVNGNLTVTGTTTTGSMTSNPLSAGGNMYGPWVMSAGGSLEISTASALLQNFLTLTHVAVSPFNKYALALDENYGFYIRNITSGTTDLSIINGNIGLGTTLPTNRLHLTAATNPLRIGGLTSATDDTLLTIDASGVVHTINVSGITALTPTLYTSDGTLNSNRTVDIGTNILNFSSSTHPDNFVLNGAGNIGINTASPLYKLDINGTANVNGDLTITSPNYLNLSFVKLGGSINAFGIDYATFAATSTNTGIALVANANGNPAGYGYAFQFKANQAANQLLFVGDNTTQAHYIHTDASPAGNGWPLIFGVAPAGQNWNTSSNLLVLTSGQTIGIGTASPTNKLHISAATDPLRIEGLTSATDNTLLSIDSSGVVHTINVSAITASISADTYTTGATYSNNTFTFTNNTGGTYSVLFNTLTGLTINGNLNVTGNTVLNALTANTISAATYQNLPTDIRTTGATYSNNTFTFTNNTGGTYSVLFNTLTGLTINGNLNVTGATVLTDGLTATTISATTYNNLPNTLYTGNGTLVSNRIVNLSSFTLNFSSSTSPNNLYLSGGSVGIGVSSVVPSAIIEVSSTTKGILGPRMTEAQRLAIASPATGLVVYQTNEDEGYYIYKSFGWVQII